MIHVDPHQRLAIWGFGLAAFFLYAGFRAWSDECEQTKAFQNNRLNAGSELGTALREHTSEMRIGRLRADLERIADQAKQEPSLHIRIEQVEFEKDVHNHHVFLSQGCSVRLSLIVRNRGGATIVRSWTLQLLNQSFEPV